MIPGTILLIEKDILAISVDDECSSDCDYALTGADLPASDKKGLTVILLSAYNDMRSFLPSCLNKDFANQCKTNNFLWQCWREQCDLLKQNLFKFTDILSFPLRSIAGDLAYDVLWIHRHLNFLRDLTKISPVPSWTGERGELVRWLENQQWEQKTILKGEKNGRG